MNAIVICISGKNVIKLLIEQDDISSNISPLYMRLSTGKYAKDDVCGAKLTCCGHQIKFACMNWVGEGQGRYQNILYHLLFWRHINSNSANDRRLPLVVRNGIKYYKGYLKRSKS